jgi:hypothetical protein
MPQSFSRGDWRGNYNGTPLRTSTHGGRLEESRSTIERSAVSKDIGADLAQKDTPFIDAMQGMDQDSAGIDATLPSRPVYIVVDDDDEPPQPIRTFAPAKRQKSPSHEQPTKRARYQSMDIEIIDLTSSPPPKHHRYNSDNRKDIMDHPSSPMSSTPTEFISSPDQSDYDDYDEINHPPSPRNHKFSSLHRRDNKSQKPIASKPFTLADCSPEQQRILDLVNEGKNIFFTGSAGVGKSFVLQKICELFQSQGMKQFDEFFITASTGIYTCIWC